ncbi:MAG: NYN domain-containing protein [bacterium]|nr:NYN domain-containing protein [bacterium]
MSKTKVAVLVDLANISCAFDIIKTTYKMDYRTRIDYNKLISAVTLGSEVISKSVYVGTKKTADEKAQKSFLNYFSKSGFKVVTKECKVIRLDDGTTKNKANFDVEITLDTCCHIWKRECSEVILISGDSDFAYLVDTAKELDFKITVVSSKATISTELREKADRLILLDDLDLKYLAFSKNGS